MSPGYGLAEHTVYVCDGGKARLRVVRRALEVRALTLLCVCVCVCACVCVCVCVRARARRCGAGF